MTEIYEFITQHGKLTEAHRADLKKKRGFTDETIDTNRFFSGGKYLLEFEQELINKFEEKELLMSGVCQQTGNSIQMASLLLDDRIVIPYINQKDEVTLLRPHKLGLKNVEVQIYQERNVTSDHLIITEGEFKAAAACQLGFPAVAVPGVGSFCGKHFHRMAKFLDDHKVKEVIMMFDNEVKDDPKFANYKEKPFDRWDTQFYSYLMAKDIEKLGVGARVATLPDTWRQEGKIDIDGAVAAGRTADEFKRVINAAVTWKYYVEDLPEEAQKIIRRKNKKRFTKDFIKKDWGKYVAIKDDTETPISNFLIKIVATHQTMEGIVRSVFFVNEFGDRSEIFSIRPADMSRADSFSTFCLSKGNFVWRGSTDHLKHIWETEFLEDDGRIIYESDHVGWMADERMWLFQNVAIKEDGTEIRPDGSNIFWNDNKGIKPVSIEGDKSDGKKNAGKRVMDIPALNINDFDPAELRQKLSDSIGYEEACICLGWCFAVFFLDDVFNRAGCFPFLFLAGKTSSGKSHVASWLMRIFGVETEGIQAEETTAVGLQRYLSYYSSLPVFMDEYRNNDKVINKNGLIRNAYNRQLAVKGIKADFGIRQAKVRGTMIISGQEGPRDNAIMTRCINVIVSANRRSPERNPFDWFLKNRDRFSRIGLDILRDKEAKLKVFNKVFDEGRVAFNQRLGIDSRKAINYAIVAAGYAVVFGEDTRFADILAKELQRVHYEISQEEESLVFWDDLLAMKHAKALPEKNPFWTFDSDNPHVVYVYFEGLYREWAADYGKRNRDMAFSKQAIRDIIRNEPYYLDMKDSTGRNILRRFGGNPLRCLAINLQKAPDSLQSLVGCGMNAVTPEKQPVTPLV